MNNQTILADSSDIKYRIIPALSITSVCFPLDVLKTFKDRSGLNGGSFKYAIVD